MFAHRSVYAEKPLHKGAFTDKGVYTQKLLHTHRDAVARRSLFTYSLSTQKRLQTETSTQRSLYTESLYTRKLSHTQKFLHREVFTQRSFYTQKLLHTEAFTQRSRYRKELLQTRAFTYRSCHHIPGIPWEFSDDIEICWGRGSTKFPGCHMWSHSSRRILSEFYGGLKIFLGLRSAVWQHLRVA